MISRHATADIFLTLLGANWRELPKRGVWFIKTGTDGNEIVICLPTPLKDPETVNLYCSKLSGFFKKEHTGKNLYYHYKLPTEYDLFVRAYIALPDEPYPSVIWQRVLDDLHTLEPDSPIAIRGLKAARKVALYLSGKE